MRKLTKITFLIIIVLRILFMLTYPLNVSGDGRNYFHMMVDHESSLIHAGGYPFLFGLLFKFVEYDNTVLMLIQHTVDVATLALLFVVLKSIFGNLVACMSVLLCGLDPFIIGDASTTRPEWFQADLVILSLVAAYCAFRQKNLSPKFYLYGLAAFIFAWSYLVKFNSITFMLLFIFLLFAERISFRHKAIIGLAMLTIVGTTVGGYVALFHKPSTGTATLTHDKAWIFARKALSFVPGRSLSADNGIYTKRYLLLNKLLPIVRGMGPREIWSHLDAVPKAEREHYRTKYLYILDADEETLDEELRKNSVRPVTRINFYSCAYYIGLEENDELGIHLFLEALRRYPLSYVRTVFVDFLKAFELDHRGLNFAVLKKLGSQALINPEGMRLHRARLSDHLSRLGYFAYYQEEESFNNPYSTPIMWLPGVVLFSVLAKLRVPIAVMWLVIFASTPLFLKTFIRDKSRNIKVVVPLLLLSVILAFILQSVIIYFYRGKDLRLIQPFIYSLFSVGVLYLGGCISSFLLSRSSGSEVPDGE